MIERRSIGISNARFRNKVKCRGRFTPKILSFAPLIFDNSTAHWVSLELNLFVLWLYPVLCTLNLQIISQIFTPRPWYLQSKEILHGHLFLDCFLLVYLYYFESWITTQFGSWIIKARYSWWNKFKKPENGKDYAFMIEAVAVYVNKILRKPFGYRDVRISKNVLLLLIDIFKSSLGIANISIF